jgi:hypothetical protein
VTAQVGQTWHDLFTMLEIRHGLDINSQNHIWLLQHLFLPLINQQLSFFAEGWNNHTLQIRNGPNRSPIDFFIFDMLVYGMRGRQLELNAELEVYGIDWDGLNEDPIRLHSSRTIPLMRSLPLGLGKDLLRISIPSLLTHQ